MSHWDRPASKEIPKGLYISSRLSICNYLRVTLRELLAGRHSYLKHWDVLAGLQPSANLGRILSQLLHPSTTVRELFRLYKECWEKNLFKSSRQVCQVLFHSGSQRGPNVAVTLHCHSPMLYLPVQGSSVRQVLPFVPQHFHKIFWMSATCDI